MARRHEKSRGGRGVVGRHSASSAQSKRVCSGEPARFGLGWGGLGQTGGERGAKGVDGVVGDAGEVYHTDDAETARLRGVWGKPGGGDTSGGVCDTPGGMFLRSGAVVCVPEWGRGGGTAIIDAHAVDDVAELVDAWGVVVGSWWIMGARGTSWGGLEGMGRVRCRR